MSDSDRRVKNTFFYPGRQEEREGREKGSERVKRKRGNVSGPETYVHFRFEVVLCHTPRGTSSIFFLVVCFLIWGRKRKKTSHFVKLPQ